MNIYSDGVRELLFPLTNGEKFLNVRYRFPMQTKKSQPEGDQIMPEMRFTEFQALSVDLRVGISRSVSETNG